MAWLKCHSPIVCLPRQDSSNWVPWQGQARLCCFSLYLSTKTHYSCTHTCTKDTDNHQTCMRAYARTQTQYLLRVVTDWVNAAINGWVYNVSIQNGGLREKQVLSQSVGRGERCNSSITIRPLGVIHQFPPQPLSALASEKLRNITFSYLPIPV